MRESRNGSGSRWWGWVVASAAVAVVLAGVGAWLLVDPLSVDEPKDRANTMQAALAIAFGFGGLATLGLFTRRQWHQERVAEDARHDAEQRRITEQYVQAVEQLGHEKAPVRLGGLYALDRLGRNHPEQRQVIAEVWCAYLRRRYTPPPEVLREVEEDEEGRSGGEGGEGRKGEEDPDRSEEQRKADAEAAEEYEVRMTAQRLLARHLRDPRPEEERDDTRPSESEEYWHLESIDLTGAVLIDADFRDCRFPMLKADRAQFCHSALFPRACFEDGAEFVGARFGSDAEFREAQFKSVTCFGEARFESAVWFKKARFGGDAWFEKAWFGGDAWFEGARFGSDAEFRRAWFEGNARFMEAQFGFNARFMEARFGGDAWFEGARFGSDAEFRRAWFGGDAWFEGVRFGYTAEFRRARFGGYACFEEARFEGIGLFWGAKFEPAAGGAEGASVVTSLVDMADAVVDRIDFRGQGHVWPPGWRTVADGDKWKLVPVEE